MVLLLRKPDKPGRQTKFFSFSNSSLFWGSSVLFPKNGKRQVNLIHSSINFAPIGKLSRACMHAVVNSTECWVKSLCDDLRNTYLKCNFPNFKTYQPRNATKQSGAIVWHCKFLLSYTLKNKTRGCEINLVGSLHAANCLEERFRDFIKPILPK